MKKILVLISSALLLTACSSSSAGSSEYQADETHLQNITLTGRDNTFNSLQFNEDELTVTNNELLNSLTPEIDTEEFEGKENIEKVYTNIKVSAKDDTYTIKADGLSMKLVRTGERILTDENGEDYQTNLDLN